MHHTGLLKDNLVLTKTLSIMMNNFVFMTCFPYVVQICLLAVDLFCGCKVKSSTYFSLKSILSSKI